MGCFVFSIASTAPALPGFQDSPLHPQYSSACFTAQEPLPTVLSAEDTGLERGAPRAVGRGGPSLFELDDEEFSNHVADVHDGVIAGIVVVRLTRLAAP